MSRSKCLTCFKSSPPHNDTFAMDCKYCGDGFDSELGLHQHWLDSHRAELTGHEKDTAKRTVKDANNSDGGGFDPLKYRSMGIAAVLLVGLVAFGYAGLQTGVISFTTDSSITSTPSGAIGAAGSTHYHLPMEVIVNGERIDFSQPQYQVTDSRAHFEGGDGTTLHMHATNVPLKYVFSTFGWELGENKTVINGQTFDTANEVTITAGGQTVEDPWNYVPENGVSIRVTANSS